MSAINTRITAEERSTMTCRASSSTAVTVVPLALVVAATSFKLLLWRARAISRWLDEDASIVWSDGGTMLDCSDESFHQCIIKCAVDRGNTTLSSESTNISDASHQSSPKYYQSSSSSGESSENDVPDNSNESEENNDIIYNNAREAMAELRQMSRQVGGMASHKHPVQTFGDFILKPLRLLSSHRGFLTELDANHDHHATNKHKDGHNDTTKAYRGVREIAFYESLYFASTMPSDYGSHSTMLKRVYTKYLVDNHDDGIENWRVIMHLLSLYSNTPSSGHKHDSFIQSCRHPCTGYHSYSQSSKQLRPSLDNFKSFLPNLGYFNSMAILIAYYAGDPVALSSVKMYAHAWCALIREVEALKKLSRFTSPYYGVVDLDKLEQGGNTLSLQKPHLLLRNLTIPFHRPNIIDIKMGTQTYEPSAPLSKQLREAGKYPRQSDIGFRIVGMRVCIDTPNGSEYKCWDKSFGVSLNTRDDVAQALETFFLWNGDVKGKTYSEHVISCVIKQLTHIKNWFEEENTTLAFYASSILIVYDGDPNVQCDKNFHTNREPIVKMIDFAHVCRNSGGDAGYLEGIGSLLSILRNIQKK